MLPAPFLGLAEIGIGAASRCITPDSVADDFIFELPIFRPNPRRTPEKGLHAGGSVWIGIAL